MRVKGDVCSAAYCNWRLAQPIGAWKIWLEKHFCSDLDITAKQWARYKQTGKLHVTPMAARKLVATAALTKDNIQHHHTLMKIIEARYGNTGN